MKTMEIVLLGGGAVLLGYLFLTKDGKQYVESLMNAVGDLGGGGNGGGDEGDEFDLQKALVDYRESVADDPDAFTPGTSRYQEIVRRNRGKAAASELFRKTNRS
jgi:hypothetical protein